MGKVDFRSPHESYINIKNALKDTPINCVVRFGDKSPSDKGLVECNTADAVTASANKRLMKSLFDTYGVTHANWAYSYDGVNTLSFPIVAKHPLGSKGTGVYLLKTKERFNEWWAKRTHHNYIFEEFHDYSREYRLLCNQKECFLAVRKVLKKFVVKNKWKKGGDNTYWYGINNPKFETPVNWELICNEAVKAVKAVGLDIGGVDVKVQAAFNKEGVERKSPKFIVLEVNSAPCGWGEKTTKSLIDETRKVIIAKSHPPQ